MSNGSLGDLVHEAERGQGQPLHHDLHAEVGHVPAAVVDDVVEQHPQVGVDLVVAAELLVDVAGEDLDVAGLVDDLRGGVELGVVPGHGLDDLGGAEQRALLAVHELAEAPAPALHAELDPLPLVPLLDRGADVDGGVDAGADGGLVGGDGGLEVDLRVPGQVGGGVPLAGLGLLVELAQRRPGQGVVPGEDGVGVVLDDVLDRLDVGVGHGSGWPRCRRLGTAEHLLVLVVVDMAVTSRGGGRVDGPGRPEARGCG